MMRLLNNFITYTFERAVEGKVTNIQLSIIELQPNRSSDPVEYTYYSCNGRRDGRVACRILCIDVPYNHYNYTDEKNFQNIAISE